MGWRVCVLAMTWAGRPKIWEQLMCGGISGTAAGNRTMGWLLAAGGWRA